MDSSAGRLRIELEPVLGREVVEEVRRPAGLDQVRRDHGVVGRCEREVQRLRVVGDDLGIAKQRGLRRLPVRDLDAVVRGDRDPVILDRHPDPPARRSEERLAPGDRLAFQLRSLLRRQGGVEFVDAVE